MAVEKECMAQPRGMINLTLSVVVKREFILRTLLVSTVHMYVAHEVVLGTTQVPMTIPYGCFCSTANPEILFILDTLHTRRRQFLHL